MPWPKSASTARRDRLSYMHILVDISAHGLGHLAQTAPVLDALKSQVPDLQVTVRSGLTQQQLIRRIRTDFQHIAQARDIGFVMHNAVDIDLQASALAYRDFHGHWEQKIQQEASWLHHHNVDAVLTNVAYLPIAAAAAIGLPAVSFCSLNWGDLFAHYFGDAPWAVAIQSEIYAAYRKAGSFLRVTPGLPMTALPNALELGPIAEIGRRRRDAVAQLLHLDTNQRWILLAMGGLPFRIPMERWHATAGITWLVPQAWQLERDDIRAFDRADVSFSDLLASVDAVVTKPGYGTFVEAACSGIPILYLQRPDWPETEPFAAWLATHARSQEISRSQLWDGDLVNALEQLWQAPIPGEVSVYGIQEAVTHLIAALRLTAEN